VKRVLLFAGLPLAGAMVLLFYGPIPQDPAYHDFADRRALWGIPNFWNTVSNLPFLLVALWGLGAVPAVKQWEREAYAAVLAGTASIAAGSSYYHLWPGNGTLFWDRLPMTMVFMALLATFLGERVSPQAGRRLLLPLLALGAASVVYWRCSGDLRLYGLVQFYPMAALPLMVLLFPARYTGTGGIWAMFAWYGLAKILEAADFPIAARLPVSGHSLKHLAAAAAMACYVSYIAHRRPVLPC